MSDELRQTRPEWVTCIRDTAAEARAWCGRDARNVFAFQDVDHAALNGRAEGRLTCCPECRAAVVKALRNG